MTVTAVRMGGHPDLPLLVLGPSLGTSAITLWSAAAAHLGRDFQVVAWDLPGHGTNRVPLKPDDRVTMADLAADVLEVVDSLIDGFGPARFHYAGNSVGGAVGLQLLLDAPDRVASATLLCTGAQIGTAESWSERIETVRASGTPALVGPSAERWFAPGFLDQEPERGSALLDALSDTDDDGYAAVCSALATFDVRDRLPEITVPVLAVAGSCDEVAPASSLALVAEGVAHGRLVVLDDVGHLAPAEAPEAVARLIREQAYGVPARDDLTVAQVREQGMAVRREVLGAVHVDRATAAATDLTSDFQRFITEYAWGGIWTRPGLDRRSRSLVTLTALVARGHHEELAMHVRAARTNGLTVEEIKEVLLQTAIYCGVPDANTAFRIAQRVLAETDEA
jgi:3-oxoadipate enol-lactonase / 4-carboxymuconolactone decarboxylase